MIENYRLVGSYELEGTNRVYEILIVQNLIFYLCTSHNPNLVWPCFDHISRVLLFSLTALGCLALQMWIILKEIGNQTKPVDGSH